MTATAATARAPPPRALAGRLLLLLCFLASAVGLGALAQGSGGYCVPGDPKAGMAAFFDKGCARCHAVLGEGGQSAPDLARAPAGHVEPRPGHADLDAGARPTLAGVPGR